MKKLYWMAALCGLVMMSFTACNQNAEIGTRDQLVGHWQGTNPTTSALHFIFQDEAAEDGYAWGFQWNENDEDREFVEVEKYHANGWFQWKKGDKYIRMKHMISASQAQAAIDQTLYVLTDTDLSMDDAGTRIYLKKIIPAEPEEPEGPTEPEEPEEQEEEPTEPEGPEA